MSLALRVLSALLLLVGSSLAVERYVTTSGGTTPPCTQSAPCSLSYAVNTAATGGDIVHVAAGTYDFGASEFKISNKTGSAGNYIDIVCDTYQACVIQSAVTGNVAIVDVYASPVPHPSYLKIRNFEIKSSVTTTGAQNNNGIFLGGAHYVITGNKIHNIYPAGDSNGGAGILFKGPDTDTIIDRNLIYDIGWNNPTLNTKNTVHGIYINGNAYSVRNNIIYHVNGGWGIQTYTAGGGTNGTIISNNTVFSNGNGGIVITDNVTANDYNTVTNNIFLNNGLNQPKCGIYMYATTSSHNLFSSNEEYGNAGGNECLLNGQTSSNNLNVDPSLSALFENWQADGSGNYHEKAGSPTIDAGTTTCASGSGCAVSTDYDSYPRPYNNLWDIGAFEFRVATQSGTASRIRTGSTLPSICSPGDVFFKTAAPIGIHECRVTNTWTAPHT